MSGVFATTERLFMKNISTTTLFLDLVRIPSPSGEEKSIGIFIQRYLDGIGIKSRFDNAGRKNNSNSGNLIAKIPGTTITTILFVAHMDTVEKGDRLVKPKLMNEIIVSNGDTILGADNKASIACILSSITEILSLQKRPTVIFIFSTREEAGKKLEELNTSPLEYYRKKLEIYKGDEGAAEGTYEHQQRAYYQGIINKINEINARYDTLIAGLKSK